MDLDLTYEDDATAPDIYFATSVERVADDELGCGVAWTSTTGLHQITPADSIRAFQAHLSDELLVAQVVFDLLAELVIRIESIGEAEVRYYDITIAIQKKILQLQISMHNAFLVQITHSGDELSKQAARSTVLEISVV